MTVNTANCSQNCNHLTPVNRGPSMWQVGLHKSGHAPSVRGGVALVRVGARVMPGRIERLVMGVLSDSVGSAFSRD
jgi:hypothetical protein